jgi:hypothetical protein
MGPRRPPAGVSAPRAAAPSNVQDPKNGCKTLPEILIVVNSGAHA